MTKLTDLRKKFASGMERGYITSDDWRDEVLPMLDDAERFDWLERECIGQTLTADGITVLDLRMQFGHFGVVEDLRSAIDDQRKQP